MRGTPLNNVRPTSGADEFIVTGHDSFKRIQDDMKSIKEICDAVIKGFLPAAYISGPPGIGKNMSVRASLDEAGISNPVRCNPRDYRAMETALVQGVARGVPVWFDEADVIWRRERMLQLLTLATTDQKRDRVHAGKFIGAPIIVTTNVKLEPPYTTPEAKLRWPAIFSRSAPLTIRATRQESIDYAVRLAMTTSGRHALMANDTNGDGIGMAVRDRACAWFRKNGDRLREPSPRVLKNVGSLMNLNAHGHISDGTLNRSLTAMLT